MPKIVSKRALERILAGRSTPVEEARRLRVSLDAVYAALKIARRRLAAAVNPSPAGQGGDAVPPPSPIIPDGVGPAPAKDAEKILADAVLGVTGEASGGAAGNENETPPAGEGGAAPPPVPPPPSLSPEKFLLFSAEFVLKVSVRLCARSHGVAWEEVRSEAEFSAEERDSLAFLAPLAAPYFVKIVQSMDKVGALLFGALYIDVLSGRFTAIKAKAPKKPDGGGGA